MRTKDPVLAALGRKVRISRNDRGMTMEQLASEAGVSVRTLSNIEKGRTKLSNNFRRVAHMVGVEIPRDLDKISGSVQNICMPAKQTEPEVRIPLKDAEAQLQLIQQICDLLDDADAAMEPAATLKAKIARLVARAKRQ